MNRPAPPSLDVVVERLREHEPSLISASVGWRAATAMILHDHPDHGVELLLIQRTTRPGDRWSGQMALPGGKQDHGDRDLAATATREAREEVGIDLREPVARLDDVGGRVVSNAVSTFAFVLERRPTLVLEEKEVDAAVWLPVSTLFDPASAVRYRYLAVGSFPAIEHRGYVVWGLTYRILEHFAAALGRQLPKP
ncbi:MAG: CoA pyrophosphatase [Nitriliruptorales bacterium]|nr:CoA pyrophosphatase [Nitriliruptorales bacterium]